MAKKTKKEFREGEIEFSVPDGRRFRGWVNSDGELVLQPLLADRELTPISWGKMKEEHGVAPPFTPDKVRESAIVLIGRVTMFDDGLEDFDLW